MACFCSRKNVLGLVCFRLGNKDSIISPTIRAPHFTQVVSFYGMSFIIGWNPLSSCLTTSSPVLKAQKWMLPNNLRGQKKKKEGVLFETLASKDFILTSNNRNCWVLPPAFPLRARGIPICYWLNVCVPLKFLGWSSNLQCSITWSWGLCEVMRFRCEV